MYKINAPCSVKRGLNASAKCRPRSACAKHFAFGENYLHVKREIYLLIVWNLTPCSTVFQLYHSGQSRHLSMLSWISFNQHSAQYFFPSHWLLSLITIVETTDSKKSSIVSQCINTYHNRFFGSTAM